MPRRPKPPDERGSASKPGNRFRECTYLEEDEAVALQAVASEERTSKAEILRRALRSYLDAIGHSLDQ